MYTLSEKGFQVDMLSIPSEYDEPDTVVAEGFKWRKSAKEVLLSGTNPCKKGII